MKIKGQEIRQKDIDRFESKIFMVTEGVHVGCYETTYSKVGGGYSIASINSKNILAHRLMYQIWYPDEDIDDKVICHTCDNPSCVNPKHLFSGTTQDNMNDMVNKGRQLKGSKNGNSKLTDENIVEIINLTLSGHFTSCKDIAKHYNISNPVVSKIINQQAWTHVTKDFDMVKVKLLLDNNKGSNHPYSAFDDDQVRDIRVRLKNGETQTSLANFYNVSFANIHNIATGRTYKSVV